jgi:hypothetical protein
VPSTRQHTVLLWLQGSSGFSPWRWCLIIMCGITGSGLHTARTSQQAADVSDVMGPELDIPELACTQGTWQWAPAYLPHPPALLHRGPLALLLLAVCLRLGSRLLSLAVST